MLIKRIEWRRLLKWALIPVVIGASIHMGYLNKSWLKAKEMRVGSPVPYTVMLRETVFRPDSSTMRGVDMIQAVRSDGSFVSRVSYEKSDDEAFGEEVDIQVRIHKERTIRFASGIKVSINELTGLKSTEAEKGNPARWQRDPSSKCVNSFEGSPKIASEVIGGEEMIAGHRAVKINSNNATWWFALDAGCAMVKSRMDWRECGSSEKNLVALIPGEPEAALFDVPEGIREAPPSERMMRPGVTMQPNHVERFRKLDDAYYKSRVVR